MRLPIIVTGLLFIAPLASADEEGAIKEIRELYAKITEDEPTKTTTIKFEVEGDPMAGTITRYDYPEGLRAIKLSYAAGDHGGSDEHFYYNQGKVFFIFVKDFHWQFGPERGDGKSSSIEFLTETRYYLRGGTCLRALKRSVQGPDADKLPALIAKELNKDIEAGDALQRLLRRAKAMPSITNGEEAARYFAGEE